MKQVPSLTERLLQESMNIQALNNAVERAQQARAITALDTSEPLAAAFRTAHR